MFYFVGAKALLTYLLPRHTRIPRFRRSFPHSQVFSLLFEFVPPTFWIEHGTGGATLHHPRALLSLTIWALCFVVIHRIKATTSFNAVAPLKPTGSTFVCCFRPSIACLAWGLPNLCTSKLENILAGKPHHVLPTHHTCTEYRFALTLYFKKISRLSSHMAAVCDDLLAKSRSRMPVLAFAWTLRYAFRHFFLNRVLVPPIRFGTLLS